MKRRLAAVIATLLWGLSGIAWGDEEKPYDFQEKTWVEGETKLPEYPQDSNLIEFYVGPTEHNRFFVDGSTINIGTDGIVRYVVVVKTSGGATNVTLEAVRCATREFKLFAVGRSNSTWEKMAAPQWRRIENKLMNQYRAPLSRDFLCPAGAAARSAADVRNALKRGKPPDAT